MKILKLLSKYFTIFIALILFINTAISNEPVDIWNIEKNENNNSIEKVVIENEEEFKEITESNIYKMQTQKKKKIKLI